MPEEEVKTVYKSLPSVKKLVPGPEGRKSASSHISNWFKGSKTTFELFNFR